MEKGFRDISREIDGSEKEIIETMEEMIKRPAISPFAGGKGEKLRADFLKQKLENWGLRVDRYDYKDPTGTTRSNLISKIGNAKRTVWIIAHMDTVSEGDRSLWKTDPFVAHVINGRIYGRGATDNGQGVIGSMFALRALKKSGVKLKYNLGIALVADEELGSAYGIEKLLNESIFKKDCLFLVPDHGNRNGDEIEISEKGMLWMKITVIGKQVHASTPDKGKNAYRYSIKFLSEVDRFLHKKYKARNNLFHPDVSTFELTKHEKNVDSINIIPGCDVSYIDCRVLPQYSLDEVLGDVRKIAKKKEFKEVKITIEQVNRADPAPGTKRNSEVVNLLCSALEDVRGIKPKVLGIGGGTCAAFVRRKGMPCVVWATEEQIAHEPNEFVEVSNIIKDAKIFAYLAIDR